MNNKYIINWELSLNCNLKCDFCSQWERRKKSPSRITLREAFNIIENLPQNSHISFLWWETLAYPMIPEIFKELERKNITYEITTNWLLLDKFINTFQNLNNLTKINISIDWYWEYHDISRWHQWLFKRIINIIPYILEIKPLTISTVITPNLSNNNLIKLHLLLNKIGILQHKLIYLMHFSEQDIQKSKSKIPDLIISPLNTEQKTNTKYKSEFLKKYRLLKDLNLDTDLQIEPQSIFLNEKISCKQIDKQYRINEKWRLSICEFIENDFWNLKRDKFEHLINDYKYKRLKQDITENFPLDICKTCCKNYNL